MHESLERRIRLEFARQTIKEEITAQRENCCNLQAITLEYSAEYWSVQVSVKSLEAEERTTPKDCNNIAQCSHWVRNNPASYTGKLHDAWRIRQGTQKGLISVVGNNYYQTALFQSHLMNFKSKTQNIWHLIQNYQACIKTGIHDLYRHTLEMLWVRFKITTIKQMS